MLYMLDRPCRLLIYRANRVFNEWAVTGVIQVGC